MHTSPSLSVHKLGSSNLLWLPPTKYKTVILIDVPSSGMNSVCFSCFILHEKNLPLKKHLTSMKRCQTTCKFKSFHASPLKKESKWSLITGIIMNAVNADRGVLFPVVD